MSDKAAAGRARFLDMQKELHAKKKGKKKGKKKKKDRESDTRSLLDASSSTEESSATDSSFASSAITTGDDQGEICGFRFPWRWVRIGSGSGRWEAPGG